MNRSEQGEALSGMIDDAFAKAVWPEPQNLVPHPLPRPFGADHRDREEPSIRANFCGKYQSDLTRLNGEMLEEFLSMTGPAVKYYLPCFLKHVVDFQRADFITVISLINFLDLEKSAAQGFMWPRFYDAEKAAVLAFVDYVMRHIRSYHFDEFEVEYLKQLQTVRQQWKHL